MTDRILLPLLVSDEEARAQLMPHLRDLPALRVLATAPIYEAIMAMHDAGETIDFNALHARLEPVFQDRLGAIVLDAGAATIEDGLACLDALRKEDRESVRRELKMRIKNAEREGKIAEALELIRLLNELS
jgi:hypothetical protein